MMRLVHLFHQMTMRTSSILGPPWGQIAVDGVVTAASLVGVVTAASLVVKVVGRMVSISLLPPSLIDRDNRDAEFVESMMTTGDAFVDEAVVMMSMVLG
jgi:hypothetical protein